MGLGTPAAIATTTVFGYVFDDDGVTPIEGAVIQFKSAPFMINDNLIQIDEEVTSDATGLYQSTLPQTVDVGVIVTVNINWKLSDGKSKSKVETIIIGTTDPVSVQAARAVAEPTKIITGGPQGPPGGVVSVAGKTGVVVLDKTDVGLPNVDNTSDLDKPISTATQTALDAKQDGLVGINGSIFYQQSVGNIQPVPAITIDLNNGGFTEDLSVTVDNTGGGNLNNWSADVETTVSSPNDVFNLHFNDVQFDQTSSGLGWGTNGNAVQFVNNQFTHQGNSDVGAVQFLQSNLTLGNGVDAISSNGFGYGFGFGSVNANVTIEGGVQGYGFQPSIDAAAVMDPAASFVNAFYDFSNINCESGFYSSFRASPNIASIANNKNYTGYDLNPTIPLLNGNASFTGIGVYGTLGTFTSGNYQGIQVSPNITSVTNATGINVNMSNVTGTNVKAMDITGDVSINGALSFTGALSIGQLNAFYAANPVNGGGNPQNLHSLITSMTAQNATTVANADSIGVNTAMLVTLEANSVTTSGPFKLGFTSLALPCVVVTQTGATLDFMNGATFAVNLDATSTGGTIDRVNLCRTEAIPNGITTVNECVAYEFNQTFGQVGTDVWGIHMVPTYAENHIGGSLNIGNNASRKVSNSDVALELAGPKAFLNARMTTVERDAMTAIDGMQIYNTTTSKLQVRAGGAWVDLH